VERHCRLFGVLDGVAEETPFGDLDELFEFRGRHLQVLTGDPLEVVARVQFGLRLSDHTADRFAESLSREANAPLFVFDTITFQRFGKAVGRVIGQTETKLYTSNNLKGITSKDLEMPSSEFKQLVQISKGGLFSNTIKNPKQAAVSLHDAVTRWVKADMTSCKRCVLRGSWTGQSRAVCVSVPC
jgi:hypothetical protein